jgi:hypothetical protein
MLNGTAPLERIAMPKTMIPAKVVEDAVHLACRAPSYHNTQPWRWVVEDGELLLFVDPDRVVATDHGGRQALISCGAVLDHLRVAMAAAGHQAHVDYYPNPSDHKHVASIGFSPISLVTGGHRDRADAILRRRTDRLPFGAPPDWDEFERAVRTAIDGDVAAVDVISERDRSELAEAASLTDALRLYDSAYHAEMNWWTAPYEVNDGIPHSALVSAAESDRVDVGRSFPVTHNQERRLEVGDDQSTILVISAVDDVRRDILGCGETLSTVLLEATMAGLATCTLTNMTETAVTRDIVAAITGHPLPQVLVRVGTAPALEQVPPPTPRRPISEVLHFSVP